MNVQDRAFGTLSTTLTQYVKKISDGVGFLCVWRTPTVHPMPNCGPSPSTDKLVLVAYLMDLGDIVAKPVFLGFPWGCGFVFFSGIPPFFHNFINSMVELNACQLLYFPPFASVFGSIQIGAHISSTFFPFIF